MEKSLFKAHTYPHGSTCKHPRHMRLDNHISNPFGIRVLDRFDSHVFSVTDPKNYVLDSNDTNSI